MQTHLHNGNGSIYGKEIFLLGAGKAPHRIGEEEIERFPVGYENIAVNHIFMQRINGIYRIVKTSVYDRKIK